MPVDVDTLSEESVPLVERRFWIYPGASAGDSGGFDAQAFNSAFDALSQQFEQSASGPLGLCVMADPAEMEVGPEAVWPDTELIPEAPARAAELSPP